MSRRWLDTLRVALTVLVLVVGAWYVYEHGAELTVLFTIDVVDFFLVVLGLASVFVATGYTFFLLIRAVGQRLDVVEWVGLTFVANALNYLIPIRPGVFAKATYLKRKADLAYSRFSSVLVAKAVIFVGATALLGLTVLAWLQPVEQGAALLVGACVTLVVLALVPLFVPLFRFRRQGRLFQLLNNAIQGFEQIRKQRGLLLLIGLSIALQHLLSGLVCITAFGALGFEMNLPIALALVAFASIANMLAITPNNIGVQEVVMAYVYTLAGLDFQAGLVGAALIRAGHLVLTLVVAPWFVYRLTSARKLRLGQVLSEERRLF